MKNLFSNFQKNSLVIQAGQRIQSLLGRSSSKWVMGILSAAMVVSAVSLALVSREKAGDNAAARVWVTGSASQDKSGVAKPQSEAKPAEKHAAVAAQKVDAGGKKDSHLATKAKPSAAIQLTPAKEGQTPTNAKSAAREIKLSPPAGLLGGEQENSEIGKARASWFFDQRAYPNKHIPNGALQQAIEQRDAMKQRQRAALHGVVGANGIISFPGVGTWQLMGPQPVNNQFGQNGGSPTASGRVTAIAVDTTDVAGNTVYIGGAAGGVWKTTDGGTTWKNLSDLQPSLSIGSITIDPNNSQTIYVGTGEENFNGDAFYGVGILKSTNGGMTWAQMGASTFAQVLGPATGGSYIGAIAVQPGNPQIVLAAVSFFVNGTIGGIYRSTDGGTTWAEDTSPQGLAATSVVFEPTSNAGTTATAWMAMGDPFGETANGVYKSTDSGATWVKQTGTGANILPTANVGRIILGYANGTSGSGATIYAAIADSTASSNNLLGLYKTADGGANWTHLTAAPAFCNSQCWYDMSVGVDPANASVVVVGGGASGIDGFTSLFQSPDGGTTWTGTTGSSNDFSGVQGSTHPHVDTHAIVFTPVIATNGGNPRLYVGNDGGMWRTDNPQPGATASPVWVDLNAQLALTQFYPGPSAGISDENSGFGGTQDNDTETFSGSLLWDNDFTCGDGGFTAIDPIMSTTVYTTCDKFAGAIVAKSVFNGAILSGPVPSFSAADSGISKTDAMEFIPPLAIDPKTVNPAIGGATTLYFGTCEVYKTTDAATTWTATSVDLTVAAGTSTCSTVQGSPAITNIEVAQGNSQVVVAGTSNGLVWESTTGGAAWTEIDHALLPVRSVTAVRTKRNNSTGQIVYVTLSGFGACAGCGTPGHVFKTTNGGNTWTNISGDLPDIPVNDIIVDHIGSPTNHDALYIGTDVGVFACPDPEAATPCTNWTVVGDGLPNSPVLGLAMRETSRILRAATHGRSMWQIQMVDVQLPSLAFLSGLTPGAVMAGAATTQVTVTGGNFSSSTVVLFDGVSVGTPTFVSTTQLTISVSNTLLTSGHLYTVSLVDPAGVQPGSILGNGGLPFAVMNPILGTPTLTNPTTTAGTTSFTLHFTGSSFTNSTAVSFLTPSSILSGGVASSNGTVFDVPVPAQLLTTANPVVPITVTNPLPGGGPTPPYSFTFSITAGANPLGIFLPSPIVLGPIAVGTTTATLDVTISNVGGATLAFAASNAATLSGANPTNFSIVAPTSGTACNFNGGTVAAGSSCTFGITFSANTPPGQANSTATLNVTDNSGGTAGTVQQVQVIGEVGPTAFITPVNFGAFTVNTTSPTMNATVLSLSGTTAVAAVAVTVPGTNPADFKVVPAAASTNPACGTPPFNVLANTACDIGLQFTPSVVGNETATLTLTDNALNVPQSAAMTGIGIEITSISPSLVATGGPAFTLTVNGDGFASSAAVNVGTTGVGAGTPRLTTFVSANQLLASIPASDITMAGSLAITVTTPVPGGTTSEPKTLFIAQAEPATNDNINFATNAGATPFRVTEDTTQATANTGGVADPTTCAPGSVARSVWFTFIAPATGQIIADTRYSSYLTNLSAWTGTIGSPLTTVTNGCVSGNVAAPASQSSVAQSLIGFSVTSGTTYYIMVSDASAGAAGGTLTFSLDFASAAPANNAYSNATPISAAPYSNTVNTILATPNTGGADPTPSCNPAGVVGGGVDNSVWYTFTPSTSGTITADTLTSPYATILTAVTGAPGSFTQVTNGCNAGAAAGIAQSQVSFAATASTKYYFMVSSVLGDGGTTNFHLTFNAGSVGSPLKLAFTTQPSNVVAGASIAPAVQVSVEDASGNVVTTAANSITMAIGTNAGSGTLSGTLTVAASSGVATFSNLSINKAGTGYTLSASSLGPPALTGATSSTFNVTAGTTTTMTANAGTTPQSATINTAFANALAVTVSDANGNAVSGVNVTFTAPGSGASGTFSNTTATISLATNASGVAAAPFTANLTAGGPYNVAATVTGVATPANFALTNTNPPPVITPPLSPTSATALGPTFTLTITGTSFVSGATVTFGTVTGLVPATLNATTMTVSIPAADIATGGTSNVTVVNPSPGGGASNAVSFTVNNPLPTLASLGQTHISGGATFNLTVTGTNFITGQTNAHFNGKPETSTVTSTSQLTASVAAADVATAGTYPVVVVSAAPGGGTSTNSINFTVDGYTVAGPATPPSVKAGGSVPVTITVTPTANGFTNAVAFSVSGLPAHTTSTFSLPTVTPGNTAQTSTLTITTLAGGAAPPSAPVGRPNLPRFGPWLLLWALAMMMGMGIYTMVKFRQKPRLRRYAAMIPLLLVLVSAGVVAGCSGSPGTPKGPAQITVTATSGSMSQNATFTLTVQ